jgi:hypothetical protein
MTSYSVAAVFASAFVVELLRKKVFSLSHAFNTIARGD